VLPNPDIEATMTDYRKLWTELGLDLEAHDQLMESQEALHARTHLSQKNRPRAMALFDQAFHASHAERVAELWEHRKKGGKAIGTFCIYVPDEIALAVGVVPIPLCGGSDWPVSYADKMLPRDICPIIRSTFGMALSGTCPYGPLKDFIVGETTCDAKKKTWDLFGFKIMEVPQKKNDIDRDLWRREVHAFKDMMEELSGKEVTRENLAPAVRLVNRKRRALQRINAFRKMDEPPLSGLDALLVSQVALNMDTQEFGSAAEELADELQERAERGISAYENTPPAKRIMIAGTPSPMGNAKVQHIVETSGLRIVVDESCTGERYFRDLVDEEASALEDMLESIADRYFSIDCSCFSPNTERLDNVRGLVEEYRVDGVIHNILQYCHGYNIEAKAIDNTLKDKGIPSLKIVTDYSQEDAGQIRTRVEAFAELLDERE
jgi:benzoyl-CoA reductase/2-hydroxyglutaryl-CoA dehydratase subunit BcrC/BadD/HgdB